MVGSSSVVDCGSIVVSSTLLDVVVMVLVLFDMVSVVVRVVLMVVHDDREASPTSAS